MKPRDLTDLALRNLRESILRNALTTLGVAVGVASLVAMLSLGVGLQQLASKRLSQSGLFDTVLVTPKNAFRGMGRPQREPESDKPPRVLNDDARKEMEKLPNVIEVYPQIRFFTEIRFNNKPFATVVAGMPDSSRNSGSFDGMQGNFFSSTTANEAILQIEFAKELSEKTSSLIGQELVLRYAERQSLPSAATTADPSANSTDASGGGFSVVPKELRLKIVGIVETEPAAGYGGYGNARLLMPLATASTLRAAQVNDLRDIVRDSNSGKTTYASLSVRAKSPSQVEAIETSIKKMGFNAFSLLDASKSLRTFFTVFDSLLGIFGCLALAVATLGIVNTLVMAILERRREIGVLKALGAADSDVQQLFFIEAGVMGFFGGVFGVLFGWLLGRAVTFGTNVYLARQNLNPIELSSVPWWLVVSALVFGILVSLAAGLYPASRAAKLNPVDALRYE
ncbi:MAG TPA: FtsX-like permease family protein [Candidatus Sulfotelmatobacter sp.]|jgi:putative ABC transport system permease protein|nr:FtsX-like permease family protein [Candidatus Sulfotelmatobacter sp.]